MDSHRLGILQSGFMQRDGALVGASRSHHAAHPPCRAHVPGWKFRRLGGRTLWPVKRDPTTWRETIDLVLEMVATGIEVTGVAIIVIAAVVSTALLFSAGISSIGWPQAFRTYRANLGRGILLGLELLVAADIIGTVAVTPSFETLAVTGPHRADQDIPELLDSKSRSRGAGPGSGPRRNAFSRQHRIGLPEAL